MTLQNWSTPPTSLAASEIAVEFGCGNLAVTPTPPTTGNFNPTVSYLGYTAVLKDFAVVEFVRGYVNNPTFNTLGNSFADYQSRVENILPLYTNNNAYSTSLGTRYGMYRNPDSRGLAHWTNQCLINNWTIASGTFLNAFFNAADQFSSANPLSVFANRQYSAAASFLNYVNYYEIAVFPVGSDTRLQISNGPPLTGFSANISYTNGSFGSLIGATDAQGSYTGIPQVNVFPEGIENIEITFTANQSSIQHGPIRYFDVNRLEPIVKITPASSSGQITLAGGRQITTGYFTVTNGSLSEVVVVNIVFSDLPVGANTSVSSSTFALNPGRSQIITFTCTSPEFHTGKPYTYIFTAVITNSPVNPIHTHVQNF